MKTLASKWDFAERFLDEAVQVCGGKIVKVEPFKTLIRFTVEGNLMQIEDYAQQRIGHYGYREGFYIRNGKIYCS